MVITSPIKPSAVRMIRLKNTTIKDPNHPPPAAVGKENSPSSAVVDSHPTIITQDKNYISLNTIMPKMKMSSSLLLNRLVSSTCSSSGSAAAAAAAGRNTSSSPNTTTTTSSTDDSLLPPVDIVCDEESESMQVVLSTRNVYDNHASCSNGELNGVASFSNGGGGRMSKLFKKSGSSGGGRKDEGNNKNTNNNHDDNNNTNGSSSGGGQENGSGSGGGDSNDDDDERKKNDKNTNKSNVNEEKNAATDEDDEEEEDEDNNKDNNNNIQTSQPQTTHPTTSKKTTTIFNPTRIQFAQNSTLPIHTGSESTAPTTHPSWTPVDGTEFKVRTGPNYPKNGKKIASKPSLYEVYAVRFFRSEKRTVGGAASIMPLPEMTPPNTRMVVTSLTDGTTTTTTAEVPNNMMLLPGGNKSHPELKGTKIPDVLVVHFMLPYEPPNMFKQKDDGRGGECVYYLRPSQRFLDEISGKIPATPATKLFVKWCNTCESNIQMRSRFKCMALVRDIEKHNMGLLKSYNGKPVLITESGRAASGYHGDIRYLEMTANVHYWAFMAKKGFVSLLPKFKMMQMEVGFTIEAHGDSEMPECMLGSTVLSYISEKTGPVIDAKMQEPVHEHQS